VYASWGDDDTWDIWVINADGSNPPVQLTTGPAYDYSPSWTGEPVAACIDDLQAVSDCGNVHLSWTDTGADHYNVYRGTIMDGPYVMIGSATVASYDDANVVIGTTYYYVVRPADATEREYCQSNEGSVMPSGNCVPEFPSMFLPVTMIIGFLGAVLLIQRTREH